MTSAASPAISVSSMASSPKTGRWFHFPGTGHTTVLAPLISHAFVSRLKELNIPFGTGQCLVDADASSAHRILDVIRELKLPIVLSFNRSRVMALAQGVSKATGLGAALDILRASPRNTVAIGDAENDHELLRFAEVGAAVAWGSPSLQAAADLVIDGRDPAAVGDFIRSVTTSGRVPMPVRARRRLLIGHTEDDREFSLGVRGRNAIIGETNSGKSWLAGLLCERLILPAIASVSSTLKATIGRSTRCPVSPSSAAKSLRLLHARSSTRCAIRTAAWLSISRAWNTKRRSSISTRCCRH